MNKTTFENEYFRCKKSENGESHVYILKDKNQFYNIDLTGCLLRVTKEGFISDRWTTEVLNTVDNMLHNEDIIKKYKNSYDLLMELRNRTLNVLMSYL